jgi:hypothetical protein
MITSVGYDKATSHLVLIYTGGKSYYYGGIPESLFIELMQAESIGKFVNAKIKNNFALPNFTTDSIRNVFERNSEGLTFEERRDARYIEQRRMAAELENGVREAIEKRRGK